MIERQIKGLPTEYIYQKIISTNTDTINKKLDYYFEYIIYRELSDGCVTCKSIIDSKNVSISNLDTFLFLSDYFFELKNLPTNINNSKLTGVCQIPHEEFSYYYGQPAKGICGASLAIQKNIKHKFIKGFGYLSEIKFGDSYNPTPWNSVSTSCTVDKTNFRDTTENLLFINNQFYHCGSVPDFFNKKYPHETEEYINLFPNPTTINSEITAYKINSSHMIAVDLYDNKGIFKKTLNIPNCNLNEVTFKFST